MKNKEGNKTLKTILFIIAAIIAVGSATALIIMKFKNSIRDIIDVDELTSDDYNYEYDDDDMNYDFSDYDTSGFDVDDYELGEED